MQGSHVDIIFARLAVRYGSSWASMWAGLPIDAVKADWANALANMPGDAIVHALDNLPPDRPPNVAQFRALCNRSPADGYHALPAPKATPEQREKVRALLAATKAKLTGSHA